MQQLNTFRGPNVYTSKTKTRPAAHRALLLDDQDLANQGLDLLQHLSSAQSEARVASRKRSAAGDIPTELSVYNALRPDVTTDPDTDAAEAERAVP